MTFSRREFFKQSGEAAAWIALLSSAQSIAQEPPQQPLTPAEGETDLVLYWQRFFSPPSATNERDRGPGAATPGSNVEFVQLGPKGLRHVEDIALTPEDLSPLKGDVMLDISPALFRSGNSVSGSEYQYMTSAQLRLEVQQAQSFLGLLPLLAWASVAAIFPDKAGKLPSQQKLDFTAVAGDSATTKILLPGGAGKVALHVSIARKPPAILTVLKEVTDVAEIVMPVLGLPAISVPALGAFSALCARLEERGTFLMSSSRPQEIAVTQESWQVRPASAFPFPPGDYLMYPAAQKAILQPEFNDLTIESGYLINQKADKSLTLAERADQAVKGLTYVTMRVNVSSVSATGSSKPGGNTGSGVDGKSPKSMNN
jgi:hypothetical protein